MMLKWGKYTMPGKEGLVHISELSNDYIEKVEDVVKMGDEVKVKLIGIDDQKRLKLSRKAALKDESAVGTST